MARSDGFGLPVGIRITRGCRDDHAGQHHHAPAHRPARPGVDVPPGRMPGRRSSPGVPVDGHPAGLARDDRRAPSGLGARRTHRRRHHLRSLGPAPFRRAPGAPVRLPAGRGPRSADDQRAEAAFGAQLALLPLLWVAVYGTVLELGVTVTGAAAALAIPLLLPGTTDHDWVRSIAIVSIRG